MLKNIPLKQQVRDHFEAEKNYHTWSQLPGEEKDSKPTQKTETYQEKQLQELQKINQAAKAVNMLRASAERAFQVLQSSDKTQTKAEETYHKASEWAKQSELSHRLTK